jgi:hypothetical protein
LRSEYFITLALTIGGAVAGYFDPFLLVVPTLGMAMLAHLHALEIRSQTIEKAVSAAIEAKLGEDWDYVKHRVRSINDVLAQRGVGDTYNKRPAGFGG